MKIEEVLRRKQPQRKSTDILLDTGLLDRRDQLIVEIGFRERQQAVAGDVDWRTPVAALREELEQVEDEIRDATIRFTFAALPRPEWNSIVEEHLPDDDEELPEEFMVEVIRRSLVEIDGEPAKVTAEDVEEMFATWSTSDTDRLYLTAFAANREVRSIPFTDAGTERIPTTGSNSTTAPNEGSRTVSS